MQESLHQSPHYGVASKGYARLVAAVIEECGAGTLLDYGAGKGRLREALAEHLSAPVDITEYDPAIPGKDKDPEPCELVVSIDVLEHIEPDYLDNVLDHIESLTQGFCLLTIDSGPAAKFLPDGRNAHLIQEDMDWWLPKLQKRFKIHSLARTPGGFWMIGMKNA